MGHQICFWNVENGWSNALPLGNGKMGASVYYRDHALHAALNHYDCYYQVLERYADPRYPDKCDLSAQVQNLSGKMTFEDVKAVVDEERQNPDYEFFHYTKTLQKSQNAQPLGGRPLYQGTSGPQGGEIVIGFSEKVRTDHSLLALNIEEGTIDFSAGEGRNQVTAHLYLSKTRDGMVFELHQSCAGLWKNGNVTRQRARGQSRYHYQDICENNAVTMLCEFHPEKEAEDARPFIQETTLYVPDVNPDLESFFLIASIAPGKGTARHRAEDLWKNITSDRNAHRIAWKSFWKSSITLPDYYLETLWYLYVYLLECCSGKGSVHSEQACGLSGLWDIRKPCMWGSMWYWDVNIQTAFYGTFSSNHMELAKVFCDGFLSYEPDIKKFAEEFYGEEGWALDYPHPLYHCIQPWCALFLWKYYTYTKDETFLRDKVYPTFCEILDFYVKTGRLDEHKIRHIEYDICPEQGPVTRDSVITTAALKQLTKDAIQAAKILKRPKEEVLDYERLLSEIPEYALTRDGSRWKDSLMVQDDIFLRHPSVLMAVFPADEIHQKSPDALRELADCTIRYAAENTEEGTFGFEWIAAASARMGEGESTVRILYEKGLDLMLHSNGLGYEESERFINYCHLTKPANYLPAMCEFSGGVTAVIGEMLLQELDGVIYVFPAIPDGNDSYAEHNTQYAAADDLIHTDYGPWRDCEFENLLAPGAFEVSAQMRNKKVTWIQIYAKRDGRMSLYLPAELSKTSSRYESGQGLVYTCDMKQDETLVFGSRSESLEKDGLQNQTEFSKVQVHRASITHRRIFLGENKDTAFYKAVDSFVCPYDFAGTLRYPMTPYIFDFTEENEKDYSEVYDIQILQAQRSVLLAGGPRTVGTTAYSEDLGYGFYSDLEGAISIRKRMKPDVLRRDFAEGEVPVIFGVELPAGKYDLLIISGDEKEASFTELAVKEAGVRAQGRRLDAGRYQYQILPIMHNFDGVLKISINTKQNMKWKLNSIFINKLFMV